jgi:hypothetical protein
VQQLVNTGTQFQSRNGPPESAAERAVSKAFNISESIPIEGAVAKKLGRSTAPWDLAVAAQKVVHAATSCSRVMGARWRRAVCGRRWL